MPVNPLSAELTTLLPRYRSTFDKNSSPELDEIEADILSFDDTLQTLHPQSDHLLFSPQRACEFALTSRVQ